MFTLYIFYLSMYILSYISLFYVFFTVLNSKFSINMPLNLLINLSLKYNRISVIILILVLSISGLPPFVFFFIKFNIIEFSLVLSINLLQMSLFFNLSVSTFFYLQVFNSLNKQLKHMKISELNLYTIPVRFSTTSKYNKLKYRIIYILSISLASSFLTIFIYLDFFFIFLNNVQ